MRPFRHRRPLAVVLAGLVLTTACGTDAGTGPSGDVPITARAVAAVAFDHVPDDTTSRTATTTRGDAEPKGTIGADLRYGGDGESDGDLLRISVAPTTDDDRCAEKLLLDGCVEQQVDGGSLVTSWQEEEPEEDPGYVAVSLRRDDATVSVRWSGDVITGDPREQDLRIAVEAMTDLVQDERLGLTTSQTAIDDGEALDGWD